MHRLCFRALLVCAMLLSAHTPSAGYELLRVGQTCGNSRNLFWRLATVDVDARLLASEYQILANEARQRWNDAVSGFRFESRAGNFCSIDDAITSFGFSDSDCSGGGLGDALAVTRLRWNDRSGELLDADTVFNVDAGLLLNRDIFRQVAMHELGHVMGLDHSDACDQSGEGTLMRSFLQASASRISRPTDDDIAGANAIYEPVGGSPPPDGSNSCAIQPTASGGSVLFLGLPVLLFALTRARVRPA